MEVPASVERRHFAKNTAQNIAGGERNPRHLRAEGRGRERKWETVLLACRP